MDGRPRPTSGCPSVLRLPDVHKESETPSTSGEGERKFTESSLVYIIPDFPAGANFCRIFLQPREAGRCHGLFAGRFFAKKISRARMHSQRTPRRKSLFFHKYSLAQNLSNFKCQFIHTVYHIFHQMQQQSRKTCRRYIPLSQPAVSA